MYGAIDIGGTKTLVAVFSQDGKVVEKYKFPTSQNYSQFIKELTQVVQKLKTKHFTYTVVAMPGLPDRKLGLGVAFGNLPWEQVPLQKDVESIFQCPVRLENDAKLAALSEANLIKNEFKKVLYVTVSTGIGGGIVINGKIDPNFEDIELGQMIVEHQGKLQRWEDFASGRAIVEKFGKRASDIKDASTWYIIARNLAVGINTLIATLDPEVIVIGGGVGSSLVKFKDRLEEELRIYETPLTPIPPIRQAQRAEEAVIYGCYALAKVHDEGITG